MNRFIPSLTSKLFGVFTCLVLCSNPLQSNWSTSISGEWETQLKKETFMTCETMETVSCSIHMAYEPAFFNKNWDICAELATIREYPNGLSPQKNHFDRPRNYILGALLCGHHWKNFSNNIPIFYGFIRITLFEGAPNKENIRFFSSWSIGGDIQKEFDPILLSCSFFIDPSKKIYIDSGKTVLSIGPRFSLQPKMLFQLTPELSSFGFFKWNVNMSSKISEIVSIPAHTKPEVGFGIHYKHDTDHSFCMRFRADTLRFGSNALSVQFNSLTRF